MNKITDLVRKGYNTRPKLRRVARKHGFTLTMLDQQISAMLWSGRLKSRDGRFYAAEA